MEVFDSPPAKWPVSLRDVYRDVIDKPGEMAKRCVEEYGAELISVRLEGTHPEKGDKSAEEAAEIVKEVLASVEVPLIISGHSHFEKINQVMKKVCEAAAGENCLINYAETDNYKTIAAACIAYDHTVVAQSPIDVNLAKQLNILLADMDFPRERIVMDPLTGTLGYGLEYTYSIMERIRNDGLAGDAMLAFPMLINPGYETFQVKEARAVEEDYPEWIMYHPQAVAAVKKVIAGMCDGAHAGRGE
jgi:acetyl-CoA decarbonylase/synthase complex subunit delta